MPVLNSNETLTVRGALDVSSGTLTLKDGQIAKSKLAQQNNDLIAIPLTDLRVHDAVSSLLPATAAADDLGLVSGTYGTDGPLLKTSDAKATTVTQYARVLVPVDDLWVTGETYQVRIIAGMDTTVSDTTATVDLEAYVPDGDGAVGSDICATAAQSINSLTTANFDFTITTTSLTDGDILDLRITVAITDSATATAVYGQIYGIQIMRDTKG